MDSTKKTLHDQHQKTLQKLTYKYLLVSSPVILVSITLLFYAQSEPEDLTIAFIVLILSMLYTLITTVPYKMKMAKLRKEYEQQISELDD